MHPISHTSTRYGYTIQSSRGESNTVQYLDHPFSSGLVATCASASAVHPDGLSLVSLPGLWAGRLPRLLIHKAFFLDLTPLRSVSQDRAKRMVLR